MPKASKKKLITFKSVPPDASVKVKTTMRGRNQHGRVTSSVINTTRTLIPAQSSPTPPSILPDLFPEDAASEDESNEPVLPSTRKGASRAVSVSFPLHCTPDRAQSA